MGASANEVRAIPSNKIVDDKQARVMSEVRASMRFSASKDSIGQLDGGEIIDTALDAPKSIRI